MTLLRRIQDAAVDSKTNITDVLRQCAILAARLGHEGFKKWVDEELNGYLSGVEVPPYRIMTGLQSTGHFVGPFGEQISNVPLPLGNIPEQLRPRVASMEFRQGSVHSRQWWKATPEDLISPWPADLIVRVRDRFIQGRSLMAATISMPRSEIVGLLDAIRNRVVRFALEIETQAPDAGEGSPGGTPIAHESVTHIFNTNILGGTNIAVGSAHVTQTVQVQAGDLESLKSYFSSLGVEQQDLESLEQAIKDDPAPKGGQGFGTRVTGWIGNMTAKAASGGWKVGLAVSGELLAAALRAYYNLP